MDKKSEYEAFFPIAVEVEQGQEYFWCGCGKSQSQPLCDKNPCCTESIVYKADFTETVLFCNCKQTKNPPCCDGSHSEVLLEFIKNRKNQ